eukprot:scpid8547/ scgid2217/ 
MRTPSIVYAMLHSCVHKLRAMPCYRITSGTGFIVWYNFFDRSTKLTAELRKVQQEYDVKQHKLVKPAPTRWLSLHASVMRMLEQWEALLHYFQSCPDVCQLQNVMDWVSLMERPETKAYLLFLGEVLPLFVTFNLSFQSEDVKVHLLSKSQAQLHRMFLFNCVKAAADAVALLATLPDEHRKRFAIRVRSFYQTAVVQVRRRLPLTCPVLRGLEFLCPVAGKDCAAQSVADVARAFPHAVSTGSLDALVREWQCYQCTTHKNLPTEVDRYWHAIGRLTGINGDAMFPTLSSLARAVLALPHSNADIERQFSAVTADKTKTRNRMQEDLLQSLMTITQNKSSQGFSPTEKMRERLPHHVAVAAGRAVGNQQPVDPETIAIPAAHAVPEPELSSSDSASQAHPPSTVPDNVSLPVIAAPAQESVPANATPSMHMPAVTISRRIWRVGQLCEYYLPMECSQSCIDGRSGSSACAVIATYVVSRALRGQLELPAPGAPPSPACTSTFIGCIRDGNRTYDAAGLSSAFLSVYDAKDLMPVSHGVCVMKDGDLGIRNNAACRSVMEKAGNMAMKCDRIVAGVLVHNPLCIAIVFTPHGFAIVFDSHRHREKGPMVAVLRHKASWSAMGMLTHFALHVVASECQLSFYCCYSFV